MYMKHWKRLLRVVVLSLALGAVLFVTRSSDITIRDGEYIGVLAFSPTGDALAAATDRSLTIWTMPEKNTHVVVANNGGNRGYAHAAIVWSPDGRFIATDTPNYTLSIYDRADGHLVQFSPTPHSDPITALAWSTTDRIAIAYPNNAIEIWNPTTKSAMYYLQPPSRPRPYKGMGVIRSVVFSPDGQILASGGADGFVYLWSMKDGSLLATIDAHKEAVNAVAMSPDGSLLASASNDHTVCLWHVPNGILLHCLKDHKDTVNAVGFSPDGTRLVTGSGQEIYSGTESPDTRVLLWDVQTAMVVSTIGTYPPAIAHLSFSPDGSTVAVTNGYNHIKFWTVP